MCIKCAHLLILKVYYSIYQKIKENLLVYLTIKILLARIHSEIKKALVKTLDIYIGQGHCFLFSYLLSPLYLIEKLKKQC